MMFQPKVILILLIFSFNYLFGQHKYVPFPDSNVVWVERYLDANGFQYFIGQSHMEKDTIIMGVLYQKINQSVDENLQVEKGVTPIWVAIRNDTTNKLVYIRDYFHDTGMERVLYDFSVNVGDTIPFTNHYNPSGRYGGAIIDTIDTLVINGIERLIYYCHHPTSGDLRPYIEGVGSVAGYKWSIDLFEGGSELVCLMTADSLNSIYTTPGLEDKCKLYEISIGINKSVKKSAKLKIFPNPFVNQFNMVIENSNHKISKIEIYSNLGELIRSYQEINDFNFQISDINENSTGIYLIKITTTDNNLFFHNIIKS